MARGSARQSIRRLKAYLIVAIWAQVSLTSVCSVCLCPASLWPCVIRFVEGIEETAKSSEAKVMTETGHEMPVDAPTVPSLPTPPAVTPTATPLPEDQVRSDHGNQRAVGGGG